MSELCRKCLKPLVGTRDASLFEGMHWICFHFEFEHEGNPDLPCSDPSCLWNQLAAEKRRSEHSSRTVRELGGEIWSELGKIEEADLDWKLRSKIVDMVMGVLLKNEGNCIQNDTDLPFRREER